MLTRKTLPIQGSITVTTESTDGQITDSDIAHALLAAENAANACPSQKVAPRLWHKIHLEQIPG